MAWRRFNPWPAFTDIALMLFLCSIGAAALSERHRKEESEDLRHRNALLEARNRELEKDRAVCGRAGPFLQELERCMATAGRKVTAKDCVITVGEDLVRFETASAEISSLDYRRNAEALADCVIGAEQAFVEQAATGPEAGGSAIDAIHIDGHTDCQSSYMHNIRLGAERARTLYEIILNRVPAERRARLLRRLAVRSFGEGRPTEHSACLAGDERAEPNDRRVTISVAQSVKTEATAATSLSAPLQPR